MAASAAGRHLIIEKPICLTYEDSLRVRDAIDANGVEPMPLTDFATAFESHRVVFAADRSAAENHPVKVAEFG